jgi:hypothetical protein
MVSCVLLKAISTNPAADDLGGASVPASRRPTIVSSFTTARQEPRPTLLTHNQIGEPVDFRPEFTD